MRVGFRKRHVIVSITEPGCPGYGVPTTCPGKASGVNVVGSEKHDWHPILNSYSNDYLLHVCYVSGVSAMYLALTFMTP